MVRFNKETEAVVSELERGCPSLYSEISGLTSSWLSDLTRKLERGDELSSEQKIFTDPVWGSVVLKPQELLLLDTPLLQRLRGVKQLGMAEMVYQGASFGRLEHVCGVVESVQRLMVALDSSAPRLGAPFNPPRLSNAQIDAVRLAALLHDIGHGPFSHATESIIEKNYVDELGNARDVLLEHFSDVHKIAAGELVTVFMIITGGMLDVLSHVRFPIEEKDQLPLRMISAILGSSRYSPAPYLSGLVSGPIDADKLDYMARDSHHAGLAIGLESTRLLSQLQIAPLTVENAPHQLLRQRAEENGAPTYLLGISRAGVSAYEQMTASRALLYERVYYHHKVRTTEAMVRRMIALAESERGSTFNVSELLLPYDDSTFLLLTGGVLFDQKNVLKQNSEALSRLAVGILNRDLYHRAFAFAGRFLKGFEGAEGKDEDEAELLVSSRLNRLAASDEQRNNLENVIFEYCKKIASGPFGLESGNEIERHEIIIDLPAPDRVVVSTKDLLVCSAGGEIETPNMYFNPESWMKAYRKNKMVGYVFTPKKFVPLVNIASKIAFAEIHSVSMSSKADRLTKTSSNSEKLNEVVTHFSSEGEISKETYLRLSDNERQFIRIFGDEINVPEKIADVQGLKNRLAKEFSEARPRGYMESEVKFTRQLIGDILNFVHLSYQNGSLKGISPGMEASLQSLLLNHLRSKDYLVTEGEKLGGGEADLIVGTELVIENKVLRTPTDDPFALKREAGWQARRYSVALMRKLVFTVVGYIPKSSNGFFDTSASVRVNGLGKTNDVEVKFVVPIGFQSPSKELEPKD